MNPLISVSEAAEFVTNGLKQLPTEEVSLDQAFGRILAQDVLADRDSPPFDRVMMDGICINNYNHILGSWRYKIAGTQAAGEKQMVLPKGEFALEVMTGATLPTDANCVIPVEKYDLIDGHALPHEGIDAEDYQFIHKCGSDGKKGQVVLQKGTRLEANQLAIAASVGACKLVVSRLPDIHLLTTGDEVVFPDQQPADYQIRRSHPAALRALIQPQMLGTVTDEHLADDPEKIELAIQSALKSNDVLILTGGISMGKFDWVAPLLKKLLGEPEFHGVAQRPGKPFAFWKATDSNPAVFALPGNPVSVMATSHRYLLPALRKMLGQNIACNKIEIAEDFQWDFHLTGILAYQLNNGKALICPPNNSGNYQALNDTHGFAELESGVLYKAGSLINIF